jgi:hypothetical protein
MMTIQSAFATNEDYDREQASDGESRYGAYLAHHRARFLDYDGRPSTNPLEFAAAAWAIAQSPIMSPGYVTLHPRVQAADVTWNDEENLAITVTIAADDIPVATRMRRARGWSQDSVSARWYDPQDSSRLTALCLVKVRVPILAKALPCPEYRNTSPVTSVAKDAVAAVCGLLNRELTDLL